VFGNISGKKLLRRLLIKYMFQLLIAPLCASFIISIIFFVLVGFIKGFDVVTHEMFSNETKLNDVKIITIGAYIIIDLMNVLSLLTSIKLVSDCVGYCEIEAEIKIVKLFYFIELQGCFRNKRFICDTFSKKINQELYVYDEAGKKYRFIWNDSYGGNSEKVTRILTEEVPVKIRYLKHSKIIVACDIVGNDI